MEGNHNEENPDEKSGSISVGLVNAAAEEIINEPTSPSGFSSGDSTPRRITDDGNNVGQIQTHQGDCPSLERVKFSTAETEMEVLASGKESVCNDSVQFQTVEKRLPNAVLPLLRLYQYESSESSSRYMIYAGI